jgi:hypothetical protein
MRPGGGPALAALPAPPQNHKRGSFEFRGHAKANYVRVRPKCCFNNNNNNYNKQLLLKLRLKEQNH